MDLPYGRKNVEHEVKCLDCDWTGMWVDRVSSRVTPDLFVFCPACESAWLEDIK